MRPLRGCPLPPLDRTRLLLLIPSEKRIFFCPLPFRLRKGTGSLAGMQVSFACSEHNVKSRSTEERLSRQNAGSPGARGRFRAVAMVAQSLGQLSTQSVAPSGPVATKQPGMKHR